MKYLILALSFVFSISSCTSGGTGINRFSSDAEVAAYNATVDYYDQYVCGFEERPGRRDYRRTCYKRIRLLDRQYTIDEVFDASTL